MDLVPFPPKFKQPNLQSYDDTGSPQQHICHSKALTGGISDNDALLIRLFVSTLKKSAFDWFSNLAENSVVSWEKLEEDFLNNFFDNVREVTLTILTSTTQEPNESVEDFIKRWSHLTSSCKENLKAASFAEMCMNNLHAKIRTKLVGTNPQSFNQLMKTACEAELAVKQREKEKAAAMKFENKNAAKITTNEKKKEVMVVKAYGKEEVRKAKAKSIQRDNYQK